LKKVICKVATISPANSRNSNKKGTSFLKKMHFDDNLDIKTLT